MGSSLLDIRSISKKRRFLTPLKGPQFMRSPTLMVIAITLLCGACQQNATEDKAVQTKDASKSDSKSKGKTPETGTTHGDKKDGAPSSADSNEKTKAKPKVDPNLRLIADVRKKLEAARADYNQYERAERAGKEEQRKRYIRLAHKKFEAILQLIDSLRVPPLADENEMWKKEYEVMEKIEEEASMKIGDMSKRAKNGDF